MQTNAQVQAQSIVQSGHVDLTTYTNHSNIMQTEENNLELQNMEDDVDLNNDITPDKASSSLNLQVSNVLENVCSDCFNATRNKPPKKTRTEEATFEFKATTSDDVIENPTWTIMENQLKGKSKTPKKAKVYKTAIVLEESSTVEKSL